MSQMLPEGAEVMRRVACGDVCPAPPAPLPAPAPNNNNTTIRSENKELLRQQLLSASKERLGADRTEPAKQKLPRSRQKNRWKLKFHHQALPQEYLDHYEQSLQKASARQQNKPKQEKPKPEPALDAATDETFKIWAQRLAGLQDAPAPGMPGQPPGRPDDKKRKPPAIAPSKVVTYDDLPYMGEMTLNDSKPRRGRKPKKADICHLIYENYGTVVPGRPAPAPAPRTPLQNKIISSLLQRRAPRPGAPAPRACAPAPRPGAPAPRERPDAPRPAAPPTLAGPLHSDEEPLNLCIRDLHDLKLQIQRKFGDIYRSPEVKAEPASPPSRSPRPEQPNAISVIQRAASLPAPPSPGARPPPPRSEPAPPAWWGGGVCLHPLALHTQLLYMQRLAAEQAAASTTPDTPATPDTDAAPEENGNKLVLKQLSELLEPARAPEPQRTPEARSKRTSPSPAPAPAKRKRSAIFIPPAPLRGSTAPAAEVSICKFKFTGGARPSLQEKKMLSVDAGGNLRYYSGGGARQRGYDYLQREPPAPRERPPDAPRPAGKRKSRKSLQREKLEQTFKEKGFLIQTQQLQSAEGATYCKFRQLRKFTRYLFRSWKDYLPGELAAESGAPGQGSPPPGAPAQESPPPGDDVTAGEWG